MGDRIRGEGGGRGEHEGTEEGGEWGEETRRNAKKRIGRGKLKKIEERNGKL